MAYLTEYSFHQLINKTSIEKLERIDLNFFTKNIYDNKYMFYFFNQFELKKLFREKILLSGNNEYMLTYREVPERKDNLDYVIKLKGKVKYHNDLQCLGLNKGFKNFFMPEKVVELRLIDSQKHEMIVKEIRDWFIQNNITIERYENGEINSLMITKMYNSYFPKKYGIEPIIISQSINEQNNFQWYVAKKSDNITIRKNSFNYEIFLKSIHELIIKREYLCNSKTLQNLSRYDFLLNQNENEITKIINTNIENGTLKEVHINFIKNYGIAELKQFWHNHRQLKQEAYIEISEYFKWTYNLKEKQFDAVYLETFNLECCSLCAMKNEN